MSTVTPGSSPSTPSRRTTTSRPCTRRRSRRSREATARCSTRSARITDLCSRSTESATWRGVSGGRRPRGIRLRPRHGARRGLPARRRPSGQPPLGCAQAPGVRPQRTGAAASPFGVGSGDRWTTSVTAAAHTPLLPASWRHAADLRLSPAKRRDQVVDKHPHLRSRRIDLLQPLDRLLCAPSVDQRSQFADVDGSRQHVRQFPVPVQRK